MSSYSREPIGPSARTTGMVLSEIHYHPATRADGLDLEFVELYNSEPVDKPIAGWRLAGEIDYTFPAGAVAPAQGFVVVAVDPAAIQSVYGISGVFGPWTGKLDNNTATVDVYDRHNTRVLQTEYRDRSPWPVAADGTGHSLYLANPSWGENDVRAWETSMLRGGSPGTDDPTAAGPFDALVINEIVAHTDLPVLDSIELYNHGTTPLALGGCQLSDNTTNIQFTLPATTLPPGGHITFDESQFGFRLASGGEAVFLWNPAGTRVLDAERFPAQENGVAWGRSPDGAPDFHALTSITPNAPNAAPAFADIVIHEIMYNPVTGDSDLEFIELYNKGTAAIALDNWRITDGVGFTFPTGTTLAPGGYLVVARDAARLIATYPQLTTVNCLGDYSGRLSNSGERITLSRPEDPALPNQDFVVVDSLTYGHGPNWGLYADGGGSSLELIDADSDNRRASNWTDSDESAKAPWTTVTHTGVLDNGRNDANELHVMMMGRGEALLDNVSVTTGGGANLIANGTFQSGTGGWIIQGNHIDSSLEPTEGDASSTSLKLVAQGGGDNGVNRIEHDLSSTIANGATATITGRMRWLRGHPLALLRLKGNWLEAVGFLNVPDALGSPGLPNPQATANAGPPILDMVHSPLLPAAGQDVTVTARLSDPQGVGGAQINYRLDPAATITSVPMLDNGVAPDTVANDGIYAGTIPGQAANELIAFTVSASDTVGAVNSYPERNEALIRWDEPAPACNGSNFGVYRFWMTDANISQWTARQKLSNQALPATFVLGDYRVMYDASARYRGSPFIRPGYNNPTGNLCAYIIRFSKDEPIFGTRKLNMDTLEPGGRDDTHLRERMSFWIAEDIGSTFSHQRFVMLYVNGQARGEVYADSQQPSDEYIPQWFPEADDGDLFKIDDWFEFNDNGQVFREFNENARLIRYTTTGGAYKQARYRWCWEKKNSGAPDDDYSNLFSLVDVLNIADDDDYRDAVLAAVDIERFVRTLVARHVVADWDGYGYQRGKNMSIYQPPGGQWTPLQWDLDFALRGNATLSILDANSQDPTMDRFFAHPYFRRMSWETIEDACFGTLLAPTFSAHFSDWSAALGASCISQGNQANVEDWVDDRRTYLLNLIPTSIFDIDTNGGTNHTATTCPYPLTGNAMIGVRTIVVNGVPYQPKWIDELTWEINVVLDPGVNNLTVVGVDEFDIPVAGATDTIAITFNGTKLDPTGSVVINEINYNALAPDADFIELYNRHPSQTFDLTNFRLNGIDYNFAPGTQIGPGQFLVLAENIPAFNLAYGPIPVLDTFSANLSNGGENLTLLNTNTGLIVDQVQYDDNAPWPLAADGTGPSLQLIDAGQDNNRIANWAASNAAPLWTPGAPNSVAGFLPFIPNIRINEVQPINNTTLADNAGDFDPWVELHNLGNNAITSTSLIDYVNIGDIWFYLDDGSNQGTAWRTLDPLVAGWASGAAELGYGDGGETTVLSFGTNANAKFTTTYFRRDFNVTNPNEILNLNLNLRRDDGAVVYLNGTEIIRDGLPTGAISFSTFANITVGGGNESTYFPFTVPPGALVPGVNQLAVEIHQTSLTSSDMSFDLSLSGTRVTTSGAGPINLNDFYLTDDLANLTKWQFPIGATLPDFAFDIVWTDSEPTETTATDWHANYTINLSAGGVALVQNNASTPSMPMIIDYFPYEQIFGDRTYGLIPDGDITGDTYFFLPTPRAPNDATAPTNQVWINEWMASNNSANADPADGAFDDWFELYNPNPLPVDISGYGLSDDPTNPDKWTVPNGTLIPAGGFLLVWADDDTSQNGFNGDLHTNFKLSGGGEDILLTDPAGGLVHNVSFGAQTSDVTEGSWPDGDPTLYPLGLPTPGASNVLFSPNAVPVIPAPGNPTLPELTTLTLNLAATDSNAPPQTLTYSLAPGAPTGATINPTTGVFSWSPSEIDGPGTYAVTALATDNGTVPATGSETFTITVTEVNQPPNLNFIADQTIVELVPATFTASATDFDVPAQTLTFSLGGSAPAGASINPTTGVFTWTPTEAQSPGVYTFPVVVTDNGSPPLSTSQNVTLTVLESGSPPTIFPPASLTWDELVPLTLTVGATDPDVPAQPITFSLAGTPPAGATINPTTGVFSWTPSEVQGPGVYPIDVVATDSTGLSDPGQFTITVLEVDQAPALLPIPNYTIDEGNTLNFAAPAFDADTPAESITYSLDPGAPAGATINPTNGVFNWSTTEADGPGTYTVTMRVSDDAPVLDNTETFTITVNEIDQPPILSVATNLTIVELQTLTVTATATDGDLPPEPLTFSLLNGPPGLTVNPTNGVVTWTPTEAQGPGTYAATLQVSDIAPVQSATQTITIAVLETNTPPVLGTIGPQNGGISNLISFVAVATDIDIPVQTLTFTLSGSVPADASLNPATGLFTWTPTAAQAPGVYTFTFEVSDGITNDTEQVTFTLSDSNNSPTLVPTGNQTTPEEALLQFPVTATDPDPAQTLTYSLDVGAPAGSSIHPTTGLFEWTPTEADGPGTFLVTIRVEDDGIPAFSDSETITITVTETNRSPAITPPGLLTISEGNNLSTTLLGTDPDIPLNNLSFSLDPGAPAGMTLQPSGPNGLLSWTPTEAQGPSTNLFSVRLADDGLPPLDSITTITVVVFEVNQPPVLSTPTLTNINEETLLTLTPTATDPDLPAQPILFGLTNAPTGASIDTGGVVTWLPTEADGPGTFTLDITATDSLGLSTTNTVTISVLEVASPPVIAAVTNQTIPERSTLTIPLSGSDPDLPAQTLTWSLDAGAPPGLTLTNATITWTPTEADGPGSYPVTVRLTDSTTRSTAITFTINVTETPQAPTLSNPGPQTIDEESPLTVTFTASDADLPAEPLTFSLDPGAPPGATIQPTTGDLTWTPTEADGPGSYPVTVRVEDGTGESATATFTITVTDINTPPTLAPISNQTVDEGMTVTFTATGADQDLPADPLTYALAPNTTTAAIDPATGIFTWMTGEADGPTAADFDVIVTDSSGAAATQTVTISVNEINEAPSIDAPSLTITEGDVAAFTPTASDPDLPANTLRFILDPDAPSGATLNTNSGDFAWSTTETDGPGTFTFTIRVVDDGTPFLAAETEITITVLETNAPPDLLPIPPIDATEHQPVTRSVAASDPDLPAQPLFLTLGPNAPAGMTIDPATSSLAWTPDESQGGMTFTFDLIITDSADAEDRETVTITVAESNDPPVLDPVAPQTIDENSPFSLQLTATDPDLPAQVLTYTLGPNAPTGLTLDAALGIITWTPTEVQGPSSNTFTVTVNDGAGASDTNSITLFVVESNESPAFLPATNVFLVVGETGTVQFAATDNDTPAQPLTYSLVSGPPSATLSPTGLFQWVPGPTDTGTNSFTILVSDPMDGSDTMPLTVTVAPRPVILDQTFDQTTPEMVITWPSMADFAYQLECAPTIDAPTWTLVGNLNATGSTSSLPHPVEPETQMFYRVRIIPR